VWAVVRWLSNKEAEVFANANWHAASSRWLACKSNLAKRKLWPPPDSADARSMTARFAAGGAHKDSSRLQRAIAA